MVHPIIAELCDIAKRDPLPPDHTSSHWAVYGEQTRAEIDKDGLHLHGVGFGDYQRRLLQWLPAIVGRWSHRKASSECRSFADTHTTAIRLARDLRLGYTYDVWRQTVALSVLRDHWEEYDLQPQSFLMIGDGHGFLGALVRRVIPDAHIYSVDLPKMLVFQAVTYAHSDPVACLNVGASAESDVDFLKPEDIENLPSEIDCAVNVASMAEMKAESIHSYFNCLRARSAGHSRFYCVNRATKTHPDGTKISFSAYPWKPADEVFIDGHCPYYSHFWSMNTAPDGPRFAGVRVPFLNAFDGPVLHRLTRLADA